MIISLPIFGGRPTDSNLGTVSGSGLQPLCFGHLHRRPCLAPTVGLEPTFATPFTVTTFVAPFGYVGIKFRGALLNVSSLSRPFRGLPHKTDISDGSVCTYRTILLSYIIAQCKVVLISLRYHSSGGVKAPCAPIKHSFLE